MVGKTREVRERTGRLTALLSVPMEPWVMDRLDDMAREQKTTRAELVRQWLMARVTVEVTA